MSLSGMKTPRKRSRSRARSIIVDDAHRQEKFGKVLQVLQDTAVHRNLKLIVSTRPGSATFLYQQVLRQVDASQVTQLPELQELSRQQSQSLAEQVLGGDFSNFAVHLAEIGSNSPLVIVAGGRLIATHRINPAALTTLQEFRSTIFNRLLDREGSFAVQGLSSTHPCPCCISSRLLGPVDVERPEFQEAAEVAFRQAPSDEILATTDALALSGIVTPRPKPVRGRPGCALGLHPRRMLHWFGKSVDALRRPNLQVLWWLFAEKPYAQSRRARLASRAVRGDPELNLLNGIWADIYQRFRAGDEYARHGILTDLSSATIYQPQQVINTRKNRYR